ncbi:MAG: sulfite exporter TauE/SafE family protein [Actinomycetota bacterium]|nr:sulfite exporter TauE/SafE family protein [Actinomycetota bacterium]
MIIYLYLILIGIGAGFLGSIVGIGGGIIIVPVLSLLMKMPIQNAIGTSLVAVMATSISASRLFFKQDLTNLKTGLVLEIFTTAGAITGSILISYIKSNILFGLFGLLTLVSAYFSYRKNISYQKNNTVETACEGKFLEPNHESDGNNDFLKINTEGKEKYYDSASKQTAYYKVKNYPVGFSTSFIAGIMSGLLGVGGGFIKVPTMNLLMNIPMKVAAATSNFMIGITAVASSIIYLTKGLIIPDITAAVVVGVLLGGTAGSFTACRIKNKYIVIILMVILIIFGINMILKAFGLNLF